MAPDVLAPEEEIAQLKERERKKTEFFSFIIHELRTPLTSIVGYLDLVLEEPLTAEQRNFLEVAHRNCDRLERLVDEMLLVGRIESGRQQFAHEPVDAAALAADEADALAATAEQSEIAIERSLGPAEVIGDREHLGQAVENLLSNAVKYSPEGGRVAITTRTGGDTVAITVTDSGIGIPIEEQPSLFEPYFRASNARDACIQGTGLGLALTRQIVEAHGGAIAVTSEPGSGSTFTITLPASKAPRPA